MQNEVVDVQFICKFSFGLAFHGISDWQLYLLSFSCRLKSKCDQQTIFVHLQCSFLPRFSIRIRTKYHNDNGCTENVCNSDNGFDFRVLKCCV